MAIRKFTNRSADQRGFTLVEVTIILLVLVVLSMIMLPQLGNFNRLARKVKALEDLGAICASVKKFLDEVMVRGPFGAPGAASNASASPVGLLVGPGVVPTLAATATAASCTTSNWDEALSANTGDTNISCTPDIPSSAVAPAAVAFLTDDLRFHLQVNNPLNGAATSNAYKNQKDTTSVGAFLGWRGPYFNEISTDPWGGRYEINTFGLHTDSNGNGFSTAVICISFGPNTIAETPFDMPHPSSYGILGDDLAAILSAMGPF